MEYFDSEYKTEYQDGLMRIVVTLDDIEVDCEVRYFICGYLMGPEWDWRGLHLREVEILEAITDGGELYITVDEWKELCRLCFEKTSFQLQTEGA